MSIDLVNKVQFNMHSGHKEGRACVLCSLEEVMSKCQAAVSPENPCSQLSISLHDPFIKQSISIGAWHTAITYFATTIMPGYQYGQQHDVSEFLNELICTM